MIRSRLVVSSAASINTCPSTFVAKAAAMSIQSGNSHLTIRKATLYTVSLWKHAKISLQKNYPRQELYDDHLCLL